MEKMNGELSDNPGYRAETEKYSRGDWHGSKTDLNSGIFPEASKLIPATTLLDDKGINDERKKWYDELR